MMEMKPSGYKDFVITRVEAALLFLHNNTAYRERCCQQERSENKVEKILRKLNKHDRTAIHRHYEGETIKESFELDQTYLQGMQDCFKILSLLNAFQTEAQFYE